MIADMLRKFIDRISEEHPNNCLKLYFSRWSKSECISYLPQLSNKLQLEIISLVLNPLRKQLDNNAIVEYNPIGVADGEIEKLTVSTLSYVTAFHDSIKDDDVIKDMDRLALRQYS